MAIALLTNDYFHITYYPTTDLVIMAQAAGQVEAAPLQGVPFLLNAIGFTIAKQCERIVEAGLAEFKDFRHLNDKDIHYMAEEFAKHQLRTVDYLWSWQDEEAYWHHALDPGLSPD
jgi:hypothetical protein